MQVQEINLDESTILITTKETKESNAKNVKVLDIFSPNVPTP